MNRQSTQQRSCLSQRTHGISPPALAFVNNDIVCNCDIPEEVEKGEAEKYDKDFPVKPTTEVITPKATYPPLEQASPLDGVSRVPDGGSSQSQRKSVTFLRNATTARNVERVSRS